MLSNICGRAPYECERFRTICTQTKIRSNLENKNLLKNNIAHTHVEQSNLQYLENRTERIRLNDMIMENHSI